MIRVLKHSHGIWKLLFEFRRRQIDAGILGHEQPTAIIETRHRGMCDQRRPGGEFHNVAVRDVQLGGNEAFGERRRFRRINLRQLFVDASQEVWTKYTPILGQDLLDAAQSVNE